MDFIVYWDWIITMLSLAHKIFYKNVNMAFRGEWQTLSVQWKESSYYFIEYIIYSEEFCGHEQYLQVGYIFVGFL